MPDLIQHSIETILRHQHANGAYLASPAFPNYAYSWLRDGSFIAHAIDRRGRPDSAAAFHRWVGMVLRTHDAKLAALTERSLRGESIPQSEQMHCRFTLDGRESDADWTNFQLDGYGTWLWALADHVGRTGDTGLYAGLRPQVERLVAYLRASWAVPCFDTWEEFGDKVHPGTLAALYRGLRAAAELDPALADGTPDAIRAFILERGLVDGRLAKYVGSDLVDANLLGAAVPYALFELDHPILRATLAKIEHDLVDEGVRRYCEDVYYGGGEWVLLAAWLGWVRAASGDGDGARAMLDWSLAQADAAGDLPEQVNGNPLFPEHLEPWIRRWGPVARPLLWSHAMVIILDDVLAHPAGASVP